jgi:sugar/nucleoside kinase (ribokinase family)
MVPDIATLLLAGVRHIVLTLGAGGAVLCTLATDRRSIHGE